MGRKRQFKKCVKKEKYGIDVNSLNNETDSEIVCKKQSLINRDSFDTTKELLVSNPQDVNSSSNEQNSIRKCVLEGNSIKALSKFVEPVVYDILNNTIMHIENVIQTDNDLNINCNHDLIQSVTSTHVLKDCSDQNSEVYKSVEVNEGIVRSIEDVSRALPNDIKIEISTKYESSVGKTSDLSVNDYRCGSDIKSGGVTLHKPENITEITKRENIYTPVIIVENVDIGNTVTDEHNLVVHDVIDHHSVPLNCPVTDQQNVERMNSDNDQQKNINAVTDQHNVETISHVADQQITVADQQNNVTHQQNIEKISNVTDHQNTERNADTVQRNIKSIIHVSNQLNTVSNQQIIDTISPVIDQQNTVADQQNLETVGFDMDQQDVDILNTVKEQHNVDILNTCQQNVEMITKVTDQDMKNNLVNTSNACQYVSSTSEAFDEFTMSQLGNLDRIMVNNTTSDINLMNDGDLSQNKEEGSCIIRKLISEISNINRILMKRKHTF